MVNPGFCRCTVSVQVFWCVCVYVCSPVYVHGDQGLISNGFSIALHLVLGSGLSLHLEFTVLTRQVGQRVPGTCLLLYWDYVACLHFSGCWNLDSGPHTCTVSVLPTLPVDPSPQPCDLS